MRKKIVALLSGEPSYTYKSQFHCAEQIYTWVPFSMECGVSPRYNIHSSSGGRPVYDQLGTVGCSLMSKRL
jgi:hypothetical protein